jgi:thiamine biosynthesis lipoprotein
MDTIVTIKVVSDQSEQVLNAAINQAVKQFYQVEQTCSRFDPESELMRLSRQTGAEVSVSPILFQSIKFAVEIAEETDGAFDPTIGRRMEMRGFSRNYMTQTQICSPFADGKTVSYKNIIVNDRNRSVRLTEPLVVDLSAVAKGMAIDLAAKNLRDSGYEHFMIEAGGDTYVGGCNEKQLPWRIGIRDPKNRSKLIGTVLISDSAICTSGDYERLSSAVPGENHLIDPHSDISPQNISSCTVIAPFAMLADAFSTAVFVMGADCGLKKIEDIGLDCVMITGKSEQDFTRKFKERWTWREQIQMIK